MYPPNKITDTKRYLNSSGGKTFRKSTVNIPAKIVGTNIKSIPGGRK